ncbi:Mechanosensitive ion channel protein [Seminavis robusta]|uniref:Mechanosensitive ion channel protein n=1 Tax=Seminavis robusta TaxID=568900 RepID=A0A9N8D5E8_9STRA|nr:Mechanosensitive ion channel protein [Seminavis robusta]|eukprot:Sro9_g007680.1 Mechanosensitive ion channel protein (1272) ;mRNA; f:215001-219627
MADKNNNNNSSKNNGEMTEDSGNRTDGPSPPPSQWTSPASMDPFSMAVQQSFAEAANATTNTRTSVTTGTVQGPPDSVKTQPTPSLGSIGSEGAVPTTKLADDPVQPSSLKKPVHNRTVSWGVAPLPSYGNTGTGTGGDSSHTTKPILNLQDVLGASPELEAETYILQAVEKVATHRATNTEVSGLYSSIVEDEITRDQLESEDDDDDEEDEDYFDIVTTPSTVSAASPPPPATNTRPTLTATKSQSTLNSKGTLRGIIKTHMRTKTVEGTLFGLTTALTQLDEDHQFDSSRSITEGEEDELRIDTDTGFTAADKVLETTQKILHKDDHHKDADMDIESGIPTNSKSKTKDKNQKHKRLGNLAGKAVKGASSGVREEWELFNTYLTSRKDKARARLRKTLVAIMLPSLLIALFLFYVVENPELCSATSVLRARNNGTLAPSVSPTHSPTLEPTTGEPSGAPSSLLLEEDWLAADWPAGTDFQIHNVVVEEESNSTLVGNETYSPTGMPSVAPTGMPSVQPSSAPTADDIKLFAKVFVQCPGLGASISWWFLFVGVRQPITFIMALLTQSLAIDYLALSSQLVLRWCGPIVTLFLVQSKGWPFVLCFWSLYNYAINARDTPYAHHWGYWQELISIFNDENPSGEVVNNEWYIRFLGLAALVGGCVAVKRLLVGLLLGRNSYLHYGEQLAEVMKNMVLLGEVATLARYIKSNKEDYQYLLDDVTSVGTNPSKANSANWTSKNIQAFVKKQADDDDEEEEPEVSESAADAANAFMANKRRSVVAVDEKDQPQPPDNPNNTSIETVRSFETAVSQEDPEFTESEQMKISGLLQEWEDPHTADEREHMSVTLAAVLQFRQALTFMKRKYPFLPAFGPADTRENCIESAQKVYDRLILRTPHKADLPFETLALLAKNEKGELDQEKAKEIIRAFRPDRDGTLGKLEFVRSVDVIYKELRLLSANISNSGQMDKAVESLLNVVFYTVLVAIVIYRLGEDPITLFATLSSAILAFAFMFGRSASKYFDGILFILVQRPYGVGDRVHLSNPQNETSPDGSSGWIIEKVTLFATHVYWGATNERATLCNGAISNSRVINAARSPNGTIYVHLKFGINTPQANIEIFRAAVEQYLKDRPREWLTFAGFRPSRVEVEKGYIAYTVIAQHRSSWQQVGAIIESKANLTTYCLEVSKQLEMRYRSPPLPVDLTIKDDGLAMPLLGGDEIPGIPPASSGDSVASTASPAVSQEAMAAISGAGLRRRGGNSKFADLVRMVMENNKDK